MPLRVSLSGEHDAIAAALDDAVAQLNAVTEVEPCSGANKLVASNRDETDDDQVSRKGPPQDSTPLFQLIENMSAAGVAVTRSRRWLNCWFRNAAIAMFAAAWAKDD